MIMNIINPCDPVVYAVEGRPASHVGFAAHPQAPTIISLITTMTVESILSNFNNRFPLPGFRQNDS